jgi:hypothetical protein
LPSFDYVPESPLRGSRVVPKLFREVAAHRR